MSHDEPSIQIRGVPALIIVLIGLAFLGFRTYSARTSLSDEGRDVLASYYSMEYQRYQLARSDISEPEKVRLLNEAQQLQILSLSARGRGGDLVVKVELAPNDAQPPGKPLTRYCKIEHSTLLGWLDPRDTGSMSYHLKLF